MMMQRLRAAAAIVLLSGATFGQTAGRLAFEVASVKRAAEPATTKEDYVDGYNAGMRAAMASFGLRVRGDRVSVTDNSLRDLIRLAYQVKDHQIAAAPWMATEKYDIVATMPAGAQRSQAPEMLRTLLEERFHLKLHREMRTIAVYALAPAKGGAKLTAAAPPANSMYVDAEGSPAVRHLRARSATMAAFAEIVTKAADRPVIDMTGLPGAYDFDVSYAPELSATATEAGPSLATALHEQLGLRLEKRI